LPLYLQGLSSRLQSPFYCTAPCIKNPAPETLRRQGGENRLGKKKNGLLFALAVLIAALLLAGLLWVMPNRGRFRSTMRDAVFISRIENTMKKGESIEAEKNAGAEGV
jgi:hypothetical protein